MQSTNSSMLKMLKSQNPDKEYPSNLGQKWTEEEETLLLEELNNDMEIELIAKSHNRTVGGINARRREIAYRLHFSNIPINEITVKTKLDEDQIKEIISRKQNRKGKQMTENKKPFSIESEIDEIKRDIKEIKTTMKELVEMIKAIYDFEDS
jgi:hypothetical protein